ncbi:MAG: DNA polymerase III subunit alpha [Gemmatimonadota bacterium]
MAARLVGLRRAIPGAGDFVELAARSAFSLLDGASTPEALAQRAADLGMPALALADAFDLGGAVRFTRACEATGVRPIVGAEVRVRMPGLPGDGILPLVLLCVDREGYHHLCGLISAARLGSPRGSPILEPAALHGHEAGLVCLLRAPDAGSPGRTADPAETAVVERLAARFPGRLHLALEHHGLPGDARRCAARLALADRVGVPWVPVNAPRYARPSDRLVHDVLTCLRHRVTLDDAGDRLLPNREWHLKGAAAMVERWCERGDPGAREAGSGGTTACDCRGCRGLRRTAGVADLCRFRLADLRPRLPAFEVPGGRSPDAFLRALVERGAAERYGDRLGDARRRQIAHELGIIRRLELADYFLIMWDIVRFANRRGILVQGRGSAANSAVCYCLGITAVDPIGLDLLFERFLSEDRGEPPDIDLDIAHRDRETVLQYVYAKYGREHAAMVCESITYRGRMAVRDAARVLGFSQAESDRLSLEVDRGGAEDAARRLAEGGVARAGLNPASARARALVRVVRGLEDLPRHRSIHVGGFVLSARPLGELVPIEVTSMPDRTVIQWDKDDLDLPGFIKFDLLGLGMLTLLGDAIRTIRRTRGVAIDLAALPPDDPAVYDMICAADTVGVFQIESRAQMNTLPRVRPRRFYDLVVEVALIRPGPIQGDMVHPYLRRRSGEETVTYLDPRLEPILSRTLGVPLFQEQGMKVAIALAGFTPAQADNMRRAMGFKRSHRKMEEVRRDLISGLAANGVSPDVSERVLKYLTAFANYGFPESHSASFALLVYASAYLKRYYAPEFYAALLNAQPMGFYSASTIVHDARRHRVKVRPVDLALSDWDCTLEPGSAGDGVGEGRAFAPPPALRIGLRLVRGLGPAARERLQAAREEGPFCSVEDVVRRSGLGAAELRILAEAGAFESLWPERRQALWELLRQARGDAGPLARRRRTRRPRSLPPLSRPERIAADYRCVGLSTEGHPLEALRPSLVRRGVLPAVELSGCRSGTDVEVAGLAICRQRPGTARGVMFVTLEDETGFANFVVMPDVGEACARTLRAPLLLLKGTVENERGVVNVRTTGVARLTPSGDIGRDRSRNFR